MEPEVRGAGGMVVAGNREWGIGEIEARTGEMEAGTGEESDEEPEEESEVVSEDDTTGPAEVSIFEDEKAVPVKAVPVTAPADIIVGVVAPFFFKF
jgi:hypothetical protein